MPSSRNWRLPIALPVMVAARLLAEDGQWARATTLHCAASEALDAAELALFDTDAKISATLIADARDRLTDANFDRAAADGRGMPINQTAEVAGAVLHSVIDRAG